MTSATLRCPDNSPSVGVTLMSEPGRLAWSARMFEDAGVDSLWLGEYFQSALVRAAAVAAATTGPVVGTHVLQAFARSPLATAIAADDLQALSSGRFVLGIGSQVAAANRKWHGVETERPIAMLEEYVQAVQQLLAMPGGERVRFAGRWFSYDVPGFRPVRSLDPPPVFIGGAGSRSVRAAVAVADGLLGHLLWSARHVEGEVCPVIADAGRRRFPVTFVRLAAPSTVSGWELDAARRLAHYAVTPAYQTLLSAAGLEFDRERVLAHVRGGHRDELLDEMDRLVEAFCVTDVASLRSALADADSCGVDGVLLFVPSGPGVIGSAESYEIALAAIVADR